MRAKKLTPERRLEIYKMALDYIQLKRAAWGYYSMGFCIAIKRSIHIYGEDAEPNPYNNMRAYPEVNAYKPKKLPRIKWYWWATDKAGTEKRIAILQEIISKMESE